MAAGSLPHLSPWHSHLGGEHSDEEDDDQDCCRICRGSAPPLYYPCKCSGSIKYVHQQCLMEWLGHSGNTHCELCKHEFVFTPVYAKDAPTRLPWPELIAGLIKRAVGGVKVAHRVWVVACVWLIAVPWITCLAWRLAFLRSFDDVPRLLRERWNVLAIATDCIQGSLLSIGVVFVNMSMFSLKQHLKNAVRRLENQLLRDAVQQQQQPHVQQQQQQHVQQQAPPPPAAAAGGGVGGVGGGGTGSDAPAAAEQAAAGAQRQGAYAAGAEAMGVGAFVASSSSSAAAAAAGSGAAAAGVAATTSEAAAASLGATTTSSSQHHHHGAAAIGSAGGGSSSSSGQQAAAAAPANATHALGGVNSSSSGSTAAAPAQFEGGVGVSSSSSGVGVAAALAAPLAAGQQQQQHQPQQQPPPAPAPGAGEALAAAAAAMGVDVVGPAADEAMLAAAAAVGAVADPGGAVVGMGDAGGPDGEAADVWGDVAIEELLGLQGPWIDFIEMVVLLLAGNASFMAGAVYLPLNIGRLMLLGLRKASLLMTQEQHQRLLQLLSQHVQLPFINDGLAFVVSFLGKHLPAVQDSIITAAASGASASATASAVAAAATASATAAASSSSGGGGGMGAVLLSAVGAADGSGGGEAVPHLLPLNLDLLLRELQAQMELPARADFVALSMGLALLGTLLLLGVWLYVTMRLWRAARRRLQATGRRPLLQVLRSTGRWLLSAARMVCQGSKLVLLLTLELGVCPVIAGLWLGFCALPLTASNVSQRSEILAKAPVISILMHWVIGVGFVLAFTFLLCVLREVLRPGALPFIKDPTNPERNPVREMLQEPLLKHLGRVALSWLVYAGLCVVLVHIPALLAKSLVPSLYPLRLALFDPLTQIPADMLLMHIFIPFTVEHVRVKGAVKAAVHAWLRFVARLLNWSDYLLPADPRQQAAAAAARAQAHAPVGEHQQQQEGAVEAPDAAGVAGVAAAGDAGDAGAASSSSSTAVQAAVVVDAGSSSSAAAAAVTGQQEPQLQQQRMNGDAAAAPPAATAAAAAGPTAHPLEQQQQAEASGPNSAASAQVPPQQQQQQQQLLLPHPVQWYEQQDSYGWKVLGLLLALLLTMVCLNTLLLTLPIGVGRALFTALRLPFKNDLFTGIIGLIVLSGGYTFAAAVATSASLMNLRAVAAAAWHWGLLMGQCAVLLVLWLGVVATMLGMLCELVLLPLRLPPNQTALIYLYQDWTMGVLALKLWHLLVMVAPRRDGRGPVDPDSWQAHLDALQAGGLRNLDLNRALTKIVLPVLVNLATCLSVPYVITRGLLPLLGLPASALQYANLYGHQVCHGCYVAYLGSKKLAGLAVQLHNTIRDDRYLVGRELHNLQQPAVAAATAAAAADSDAPSASGGGSSSAGSVAASASTQHAVDAQ